MRLFYTASFSGKTKYQRQYDKVLKVLQNHDVDIISPELGLYKEVLSKKELTSLKSDQEIHYAAIRKGISLCDAVVIEISQEDFQLGHEATMAMDGKKPVLCLSVYEDFSLKIKNPYFYAGKYNDFNLNEIVDNFIKHVGDKNFTERFNFFLSPRQLQHLDDKAKSAGIGKSEYLRVLIDRDGADSV